MLTTLTLVVFAIGSLLLLATSCAFWSGPKPAAVAAKVQRDVVYGRAGGVKLKLDLYFPACDTNQARPVVMYVHGGGWQMGSKAMVAVIPGASELLRHGYVVASINYRLAPTYKFPAMIEDAKCAVRFLRAHAKDFNLDPGRIGVMGDSAGGHLAALLALTDSRAGFDGQGGWSNESSRVQAVADLYGPNDLAVGATNLNETAISLMKTAFGATNASDPILARASPVTYVTSNAPPFLILHGDHDGLVPLAQSEELYEKLNAAGASATLVVITNFSHGFTPPGLKSSPGFVELSKIIADFFDKNLRWPKPAEQPPR
ncbi:MAG TPA: alpha/beta hydrolase [Verrucomicrobiae bacterium]